MRKIEELKQELKKYFDNVDTFYDLEDGQITDVLLVLRKDNVVYNAEFADDIFRFSPGVVLNHLIRSMDYGTLKSRLVSLEERFIADALLVYECECCYVRLIDGVLIADGLRINLDSLLSFAIEDNIITIVDKLSALKSFYEYYESHIMKKKLIRYAYVFFAFTFFKLNI